MFVDDAWHKHLLRLQTNNVPVDFPLVSSLKIWLICAVMCGVVCLMVYFEMGSMGRLVCHVCSLFPGTPRGVPGEGLSVFM